MPPGSAPQQMPQRQPIPGVKNLIAVDSGKGGVGTTTVHGNLAVGPSVALRGSLLVTTASTGALADVCKAIEMFPQVHVDVLGVVENMSTFACPHCGKPVDIFGHGEGTKTAIAYGVPVLGEIEIDPRIRIGGDSGKPVAAAGEAGPAAQSLYKVARAVTARVEELKSAGGAPSVTVD